MIATIDIYPVTGNIDLEDMKWAIINAGLGLSYRHGICISLDSVGIISGYRIKASVDKNKMEKFLMSPGRRLRGISQYLLKYCPEKYRPLVLGTRFLTYHLIEVRREDE